MKAFLIMMCFFLLTGAANLWAQEAPIEVSPQIPYERFLICQNLIIFWIGIIGLIVIIKMKLREIMRIQKLGADKEEKDIPVLD